MPEPFLGTMRLEMILMSLKKFLRKRIQIIKNKLREPLSSLRLFLDIHAIQTCIDIVYHMSFILGSGMCGQRVGNLTGWSGLSLAGRGGIICMIVISRGVGSFSGTPLFWMIFLSSFFIAFLEFLWIIFLFLI